MAYELWRADSPFNMSAAFNTREQALAALRQTRDAQGASFLERFVLVRADSRNRRTTIAEGAALQALVDRDRPASTSPAPDRLPQRRVAAA